MANRIKGITIEIDGNTTKLSKALEGVNKDIKETQSSLKDVNNLLKLDPTNTELLTQKQNYLRKSVEDTKEKLETEKKALEQLAQANGAEEPTEEMKALEREVTSTTEYLKSAEKELKNFGSVGSQQIAAVGEKMKGLGSTLTGIGSKMTASLTLPLAAAGTVSVKAASDLEENLNKVEVAFGNSSKDVKDFAETATTQFGLSKNAALEAASLFGDMGTSMGLAQDEAADMSIALTGLAGDLSSFKNVDIDQAMTALNGVFTGETESLKQLGVVMTQTNLEEFASNMGLVYSEMSQAEKVTLRYQYVMSQTTNAQGDYARTSDGTANSMRTLQASLENLAATFGEVLIPIITPIIGKITEIIQNFGALDEDTKKIIVTVLGVVAVIGPLITAIGGVISAIGSIMTLAPALGAVFTALTGPVGIVIAIIAALVAVGVAVYKNWDTIKAKAQELWGAIVEKFTAIKDAVVEKFEAVKETVTGAFNKIKDTASEKWNQIKEVTGTVLGAVKETASEKLGAMKKAFEENGGGFKGAMAAAWEGIMGYFTAGFSVINKLTGGKLGEIKDKFVAKFNEIIDTAKTWGKDLIDNFVQGVKDKIQAIKDTFSNIAETIKDFIGFSEPEKGPLSNFHTFAPDLIDLFTKGLTDNLYKVDDAMTQMASRLVPEQSINVNYNDSALTGTLNSLGATLQNGVQSNVTVVLEGDAKGVFKLVREQNNINTRATGRNALA